MRLPLTMEDCGQVTSISVAELEGAMVAARSFAEGSGDVENYAIPPEDDFFGRQSVIKTCFATNARKIKLT